jgi:KUP system potassium uptake protein
MAAADSDSTVSHLPPVPEDPSGAHPIQKRTTALALGALGVVFGDIGTSPLYAIRECFSGPHAVALDEVNIFGVVSLIFCCWV